MERIILHSDLNNFFASVEAVKNPLLRGKPFAVAGDPNKRHGIILAKSQEAKKYGVQTGETIWQAKQKCASLLLVKPDMQAYHRYSAIVQDIYHRFTDEIEPFGIDESWLDVTGSTRLFGSGKEIADMIRERIRRELGMTVSIGVSFNKVFAKLGSDLKKPDATTVISKENFRQVVYPLPVSDLLFVGRATLEKLQRYGIFTIGDLAAADPAFLKRLLGKMGLMLYQYANGTDSATALLTQTPPLKSVSNSVTTSEDITTVDEVHIQLLMLAEYVASRLRRHQLSGTLITLFVRDNHFKNITRQRPIPLPTNNAPEILQTAFSLFVEEYDFSAPIRCLGIGVSRLQPDGENIQLSFLDPCNHRLRDRSLNTAVDQLRSRYGFNCITRAGCLNHKLKNYTVSNAPDAPSSFCTLPGCHI